MTDAFAETGLLLSVDEENRRCQEDIRETSHAIPKRRPVLEDLHRT